MYLQLTSNNYWSILYSSVLFHVCVFCLSNVIVAGKEGHMIIHSLSHHIVKIKYLIYLKSKLEEDKQQTYFVGYF